VLRWLAVLAVAVAAVIAAVLVFSAVHLLPQLRNPFAESTTVRSEPALLQSITSLSRYEAASGSFQVVVDLSRRTRFLPPFIEGTDTLFVGQGTVIAFVDFSHLAGRDLHVSPGRTAVTMSQCVFLDCGWAMLSYVAPLLSRAVQTRSPTCGALSVTRKAQNGLAVFPVTRL